MSDRSYRLMLGVLLLAALYTNQKELIFGLIVMLTIEGVSNCRVPRILTALRAKTRFAPAIASTPSWPPKRRKTRFQFEAERAWRLIAALLLLVGILASNGALWFLPWFMGFAILGAGVSGVCPMLITVEWIGFR